MADVSTVGLSMKTKFDRLKSKGSTQTGICPRRGYAYLKTNWDKLLVLPTTCKSWSCKSCQTRKNNLVKSVIQYGLLGREWWLISVTYVSKGKQSEVVLNPVSAKRARTDWVAFIKLLHKKPLNNLTWIQVIELTRRKQLHRHIVMTFDGLNNWKPKCRELSYLNRRQNKCSCANCYFVKLWYTITLDSWVVDVTKVYSDGIAVYLTDYLAKSMRSQDRQILLERGIKRLWSCSTNWQRGALMQRRGTVEKVWISHAFEYGQDNKTDKYVKEVADHWALEQVGTNWAKQLARNKEFDRYAHVYETLRN